MAQTTKELRASAAIELSEAIRQAGRYLKSHQPSTRIIQQKIQKIREREDEFKRYHFAYHEKAKIEVDSDDSMKYLQEKLDSAEDIIDECMLYVEERELATREEEQKSSEASSRDAERRKTDCLYQKCLTEVSIDERIAVDICKKVQTLLRDEETTTSNSVLMKTYLESLAEVQDSLKRSWGEMMAISAEGEDQTKFAEEVFSTKTAIQDAMSTAVVFVKRCEEVVEVASPVEFKAHTEESTKEINRRVKTEDEVADF